MRSWTDYRPGTMTVSLLAALTTWVTMLAWTGFAERPAGFLGPILAACLMVAVLGMLLRSARVPALLVVVAQVVLLLLWLQHRLAGDVALGGLVPTPASVRAMGAALHASGVAAQTYSAPVPASVPAFYPLMILLGCATAVLVDFLAVGLRRAPLAGLPLLAVYTAPVSILGHGVPWLTFAVAALCFLFLVAADEGQRLLHWGRQLTPGGSVFEGRDTDTILSHQAVWSSARKIGFTATALAVVAPLLVPTVSGSWFSGGAGGTGHGSGDAVTIANPMVDLNRDLVRGADVDLLRVQTSDPDPSYLRISVLNSFDGNAWRPSARQIPIDQRADGRVARAPGLDTTVATRAFGATFHATDAFRSRWLPTPYPVQSVNAPGDWRYDRSTLDFISAADAQTTAGLTYQARALEVRPTAAELSNPLPTPLSVFTPNTALPAKFPRFVRLLALAVTRGSESRFAQAVALQQWFRVRGHFRYSLKRAPGDGTSDLLTFLGTGKNSRVGYCQQFAAAMAVMGRSLGIPSRVAVGFLHPDKTAPDTYVYSSHDLHAWPEMYFGGVGWVRFEPTPQDRTGDVPAYTTQQVAQPALPAGGAAPAPGPSANRLDKTGAAADATRTQGAASSSGAGSVLGWSVGLLVLVLLLLLAPRTLRAGVRRRRWASAVGPADWVESAWSELRDTALDLGSGWDDRRTVRTTALALEDSLGMPGEPADQFTRAPRRGPEVNPDATRALARLVGMLEQARYARRLPDDATTREAVLADLETCVEAMRAGAGRRRRRRATWLPASVLTLDGSQRRRSVRRGHRVGEPGVDQAV